MVGRSSRSQGTGQGKLFMFSDEVAMDAWDILKGNFVDRCDDGGLLLNALYLKAHLLTQRDLLSVVPAFVDGRWMMDQVDFEKKYPDCMKALARRKEE